MTLPIKGRGERLPLRFKRISRLTQPNDFKLVFTKPSKISRNDLVILYKPNQVKYSRLGIIIRKQYVKLSHNRNRIRRIIRESFRHQQHDLDSVDIIVLLRSVKYVLNGQQLRDDINYLWHQLNGRIC